MLRIWTIILCVFIAHFGYSQDYHHWSEHFGTRASLLGGAATSGLGDNASVYYNSASMAFVDNPNVSVTVNAYKIRTAKVKDVLGDGLDLKETQLATFPSLIAGIIKPKNDKLSFGYSINTKKAFTSSYEYLHQMDYELIDSALGPENYVASYSYNHQISEYWAGFGVSYQLTDAMAIGLAHYGIYKSVKYTNNIEISALPMDPSSGDISNVSSAIDFKYWNVKGVFKPSIAFNWPKSKLGITYTTPSFNIAGKANVYRQFGIINLDQHVATDVIFLDRREKVKARSREFGSLAIGISKKLGTKSWIHFTNELFWGSDFYYIFDPENPVNTYPDFIDDTVTYDLFGKANFLSYGEGIHSLINFGLGFERQINPSTNLLFGARTDFNYNGRPYYTFERIVTESSKWHLYHFSFGITKRTKKNRLITGGFEYTMTPSKKNFHQFVNFTQPSTEDLLNGPRQPVATVSQHGFKLILGIEIGKDGGTPSLE